MLLQKLKIDDPVDASPVHGFCGIWGVLACGFFDWGKGVVTWYQIYSFFWMFFWWFKRKLRCGPHGRNGHFTS